MRAIISRVADHMVSLVVPKTTAGACPCGDCVAGTCGSAPCRAFRRPLVCLDCNCLTRSSTCLNCE
jgi:hypothetical protein